MKPLERVAFGDKNYPNCDTSTSFFRPSEAGLFVKGDSKTVFRRQAGRQNLGDAFYVTLVDKKEQIGLADRPLLGGSGIEQGTL